MKYLLVGGSNTGKKDGYRLKLEKVLDVDNKFLGASSSVNGLLTLINTSSDSYDVLFFEYTLNDITFFQQGCYNIGLLLEVLEAVVIEGYRVAKKIVFILGAPQSNAADVLTFNCSVTNAYIDVCKKFGVEYVNLTKFFYDNGFNFDGALYADNAHYTVKSSSLLSEYLIDIYTAPTLSQNSINASLMSHSFVFVPYVECKYETLPVVNIRTSAYSGGALRLIDNKCIEYKCDYDFDLIGVLANTFNQSGYVLLESEKNSVYKNFFDGFFKENTYRVFLKQISKPFHCNKWIRFCATCVDVMHIQKSPQLNDYTMHERPPITSLHGVDFIGILIKYKK